jgi:hypothetical protein
MNTRVTIEINNKEALKLLQDLEVLHWITILNEIPTTTKAKLSGQYASRLPSDVADDLQDYVKRNRNEWNANNM